MEDTDSENDAILAYLDEHKSKYTESDDSSPKVSLDEYISCKQRNLGKSIIGRKVVFLDLRFWIISRDVYTGKEKDNDRVTLINYLIDRVRKKEILCPISDSIYYELHKLANNNTRADTVKIVDLLSEGICLIDQKTRTKNEINHLLYSCKSKTDCTAHLYQISWTKIGCMMGHIESRSELFTKDQALEISQNFYDLMWDMPLSMISDLMSNSFKEDLYENIAAPIDKDSKLNASDITSYKKAFEIEMTGGLSRHMDFLLEKYEEYGLSPNNLKGLLNDIVAGKHHNYLRTLHISACCYAVFRHDQRRKLKDNDLFDFEHAACALGYCDAFFTEKNLCNLLKMKSLGLKDKYSCSVASKIEDALEILINL